MIVAALAGQGDSGSPVFRRLTDAKVELRGMVWAGYPAPGQQCWHDVSEGVTKCPYFVANNLGGIASDLDPAGDAPLQYFTPSGGGGGGPGCIEDPRNPGGPPICHTRARNVTTEERELVSGYDAEVLAVRPHLGERVR